MKELSGKVRRVLRDASQARGLAALVEDEGFGPHIQTKCLTEAYNSSLRGVDAFFWL